MIKEFKQFLLRGNVIELAVAVVIGASFGNVVNAITTDLLTPLIAAVVKVPDFQELSFTINDSKFTIGHLINVIISFILVASTIFFFVVKPSNLLIARARKENPMTKKCQECASEIAVEAKRCAHCAQPV